MQSMVAGGIMEISLRPERTSRTLDEVDGAMELQDGILSKAGYALLDDSSFLLV